MASAGTAGEAGLIPSTDRFGVALSDIVRCLLCGHMQLAAPPSRSELEAAYAVASSDDYVKEERGQRATAADLLSRLERHTNPGSLLDVGCWLGFLLDEARRRGWSARGIEPSEFASQYARAQLGLDVETTDLFAAQLERSSFDAVVAADVIEHLLDPAAALGRVEELLRPGGLLLLTLPDAGSAVARTLGRRWWSVVPTHVQYFTRHSLSVLLARQGWETLEIATAPKAFTVGYYIGRLGGYSRGVAGLALRLADAARLSHRTWSPDFRDRMFVIARATTPTGSGPSLS